MLKRVHAATHVFQLTPTAISVRYVLLGIVGAAVYNFYYVRFLIMWMGENKEKE